MNLRTLYAATIICVMPSAIAQTRHGLAIELHVRHDQVALGEAIDLSLTLVPEGGPPFYVERSPDLGPDHINIIARQGSCEYPVTPFHATMQADDRRFLFAPLLDGDRLTQPLVRLNQAEGFGGPDLLLPHEGEYSLQTVFRSDGESVVGGIFPVWRGVVSSPRVALHVRAPDPTTLNRMRALVQHPTGEVDWDAVAYFRLVRDPAAADSLVALLTKEPTNPLIIEAIALQRRQADADVLDRHARDRLSGDPRLATYVRELVKKLREAAPCER